MGKFFCIATTFCIIFNLENIFMLQKLKDLKRLEAFKLRVFEIRELHHTVPTTSFNITPVEKGHSIETLISFAKYDL